MRVTRASRGRQIRVLFPILFLVLVSLPGCSETAEPTPDAAVASTESSTSETATATDASAGLSAERMAQWTRNCALCHVRGEGGAPVLGDREAWAGRWQQGEAALLEHTVEGLNNMPPLGYCMDCEQDDFLALIRFMGGER